MEQESCAVVFAEEVLTACSCGAFVREITCLAASTPPFSDDLHYCYLQFFLSRLLISNTQVRLDKSSWPLSCWRYKAKIRIKNLFYKQHLI